MKKPLPNTKCTVKLRKSEYREEWYLIIESYPVFAYPGAKPSRHKEALNRTITTPIWDKSRPSRPKSPSGTSTESLYAARIWIMKRAAMPTR